jgi:hypothetical protein
MPRFYSPENIKAHRTGTLTASVVAAYESFGASGLTPAADNVLASLAGGAITAATCLGITDATVKNLSSTDTVYATARDPAGLAGDHEAVPILPGEGAKLDLAGHASTDRVWVKGPAGAASVSVTIAYTEVAQ